MNRDHPVLNAGEHQVVKFKPRTSSHPPRVGEDKYGRFGNRSGVEDLSRFERDTREPEDYRQRMLMNVAAMLFTAALVAGGVWLALKIADLRSTQDCVLMGRRDCAHVSAPAP